jgi:cytochrome c biogenesis protein CcmG/thiol:disulfide interchange protein DsbE
MKRAVAVILLTVAACGSPELVGQDLDDLPPITGEELERHLATSGRPAVVNVWAAWCAPCRSEAPLLEAAESQFGEDVDFNGIDVEDNQADAKDFIVRYGLDFVHYFDRNRSVPNHFGGIGTPITFFFNADGDLIDTHLGVIDERALAIGIDEILAR